MSRANDGRNAVVRHRQEPAIHKLDQGVQFIVVNIIEEEQRVRVEGRGSRAHYGGTSDYGARRGGGGGGGGASAGGGRRRLSVALQQQRFEKGRTGAEDELVGANAAVAGPARQRHVEKLLLLPRFAERLAQLRVVVVPAQRELGTLSTLHICHWTKALILSIGRY